MASYIKVKKLNMSQIFVEDGEVVPVTWVEIVEGENSLEKGNNVNIVGISKGKGFAGGMKRHGFHGGPATHGQSDRKRAPGSIGATTSPSKVLKGKKMAGRYGGAKVTIKNRNIIVVENNKVAISGPIPGSYGSIAKVLVNLENKESNES